LWIYAVESFPNIVYLVLEIANLALEIVDLVRSSARATSIAATVKPSGRIAQRKRPVLYVQEVGRLGLRLDLMSARGS
jgi:hypothetical protein